MTDTTPAATARDALEEAIGETWCAPTSGGTDGVWCMYHDRRMVDEERCEMRAGWVAALAAAAAPGRVAALEAFIERVATMGFCSQTHHEHIVRDANRLLAAAAPTPSEPVARCGWRPGYRTDSCGFPEDHEIHHPELGNAGWMVHPFTPGARDE